MNEVSILTSCVTPSNGGNCTKIPMYLLGHTPIIAYQPGGGNRKIAQIAQFPELSEAVGFCQVFDKIVVDGFTVKDSKMPKYKTMPERGMIKKHLSLQEAREQMMLLNAE